MNMKHRAQRVLIVDDEPSVCEFVRLVLSDAGYRTEIATSGDAALGQIERHGPFDLVVTDLMMPGMFGDELARRVRRTDPSTKILYLTGCSDRLFEERSALWEDEAFLDKPASIEGLLEAVALLLNARRRFAAWERFAANTGDVS
jgi:CheY-like chemotaxis protein